MRITVVSADRSILAPSIPHPKRDANKYTRGVLTVIGGEARYPGAVCLASTAGSRMGAGYVEVICAPESADVLHDYAPQIVACDWDDWSVASSRLVEEKSGHPQACLLGSGFDPESGKTDVLALSVMGQALCPLVIDGGALSTAASHAGRLACESRAEHGRITVLTPHFGEASRLAEAARIALPEDRSDDALSAFALRLSEAYVSCVVLKGPDTYIALSDSDEVLKMDKGPACLAKAGTGDVLAGLISSLLAQGATAQDAARVGTLLHALCGIEAEKRLTDICVEAEDLIECLPAVLRGLA